VRGVSKLTQHQPLALVSQETEARRHAEQRLQQSDQVFRLLVDSVKDYAIFLLGTDGRVVSWNQGAQRIKGYLAHEIIAASTSRSFIRERPRRASGPTGYALPRFAVPSGHE
jgi:PAS domain-containing protein